jgi:hypothetical protein
MSLDVSVKKKPRPPLLPPRWWRWPLRALVALVLALTTFAWSALKREERQGRKDLAAVIAATDEKHPRWRWHEIQEDLAPIPDDDNSAFVLQKVDDSAKRWKWFLKLNEEESVYDHGQPANRRIDDRRLAVLRDTLAQREDCIALAASLVKYPRGRTTVTLAPDVVSTTILHVDHCRTAVMVLLLDAERLWHAGRFDEAAERLLAVARASAALRDDPFLTAQMARLVQQRLAVQRTERLLGQGEISDAACRRLADHFAAMRKDNPLLTALRGERAFNHEWFEKLDTGQVSLAESLQWVTYGCTRDWRMRVAAIPYRYRLPEDHAFLLTRHNEACAIAALPIEQQRPRWQAYQTQQAAFRAASQSRYRCLVSHLIMADATKYAEASLREHALLSCAVVALAAERFRMTHKRWPKTLDELCPVFLTQPLVDPFDGQPLRLTRSADGIVVYSVGMDGVDDGGDLDAPARGRWAKDHGLRLYDPDKRGLPASPPKDKFNPADR